MRILLSWLREYVDTGDDREVLAETLAGLGLPVDETIHVGGVPGVITARVVRTAAHPDAARVQRVWVDAGDGVEHHGVGRRGAPGGPVALGRQQGPRLLGGVGEQHRRWVLEVLRLDRRHRQPSQAAVGTDEVGDEVVGGGRENRCGVGVLLERAALRQHDDLVGEPDGLVKTVFDRRTGQLLGAHMVGAEVTELIQGFVVAMNDAGRRHAYPSSVRFEITQGDLTSYRRAADFLNVNRVDVLSVQHEFGIFGGKAGSHLLALLRELLSGEAIFEDRRINTTPPPHTEGGPKPTRDDQDRGDRQEHGSERIERPDGGRRARAGQPCGRRHSGRLL